MSLLGLLGINVAYATSAAGHTAHKGSFLGMLPMLILFALVFYFLLIRPQSKRAKQQRALVQSAKVGDDVVSAGGIVGTITATDEQYVKLSVSDGVEIKMQKGSISKILPKGSRDTIVSAGPADVVKAEVKTDAE